MYFARYDLGKTYVLTYTNLGQGSRFCRAISPVFNFQCQVQARPLDGKPTFIMQISEDFLHPCVTRNEKSRKRELLNDNGIGSLEPKIFVRNKFMYVCSIIEITTNDSNGFCYVVVASNTFLNNNLETISHADMTFLDTAPPAGFRLCNWHTFFLLNTSFSECYGMVQVECSRHIN